MVRELIFRLQSLSARYGDNAPAACCGACKPCVTTAATGLVMAAASATAGAVSSRRATPDAEVGEPTACPSGQPRAGV